MASWVEDIVQALNNLGGKASLTQIYDEVKRIRTSTITPTFEVTIRRELQSRSAESINFNGKTDIFRKVDKGIWALNTQINKNSYLDIKGKIENKNEVENEIKDKKNNSTWLVYIVQAITNLGGRGTLSEIYQETNRIRNKPLPNLWQHIIQDTIYEHSSDTLKFKGKDLFKKIDKGVWGLRHKNTQSKISNINNDKDGINAAKERKMVEDNGLFLGKEILNFSIEEPIETISNLFQTIKEYRDYAKVEDISKWFDYIHQIFHIFGFGIKPITNRLMTIQDIGENQNPKALVSLVGPNESFAEIAYEVTWDSYLFYAAKYYSLEWVILTNGLQFKVMNCTEDLNKHKYYQCEFEEILKQGHIDSFFTIYKILNIINRNTNKTIDGGSNGKPTPKKPGERVLVTRHFERKEFWTQFLILAKKQTKIFDNKKSPGVENYFNTTAGLRGILYSCNLTFENARVEIYIDNGDFEWNKKTFEYFYQYKEEIENKFGNQLIWERLDKKRASVIRYNISEKGLQDKEAWPELQNEFLRILMKLDDVFQPYIRGYKQ